MKLFTDHPAEVGESYSEHMAYASSVGGRMILAGLACMIHGILPFLFKTNGSTAVARLHNLMMEKRSATYVGQVATVEKPRQIEEANSSHQPVPPIKISRAA